VTVRDWLAHREPSPPRVLRERVEALALAVPEQPGDLAGSLVAAAEVALVRLSLSAAGRPRDRSRSPGGGCARDVRVRVSRACAGQHSGLSARAMSRLSGATAP
jgi:hypothetical protein